MSCNLLTRTRLVPALLLALACIGWASACAGSELPDPTQVASESQEAVYLQSIVPASLEQVRGKGDDRAPEASAMRPGHMVAIKGAALGFLLAAFMMLAAMFLGVRVAWPSRDAEAEGTESSPPDRPSRDRDADDRDDGEALRKKRRPKRRRVRATIPLRTVRRVEVRPALCEQYEVYADEYQIDEEFGVYDELRRAPARVVRKRRRPRTMRTPPPAKGRPVAARPTRRRRNEGGGEEVVAVRKAAMRDDIAADQSGPADWDTENRELPARPVRGVQPQNMQPPTVGNSLSKPVIPASGGSSQSSCRQPSSASGSVFQQIVRENLRLREAE